MNFSAGLLTLTLLHFLWQAAGLTVLGWLCLVAGRLRTPHARYAIWVAVLIGMAIAPVATCFSLQGSPLAIGAVIVVAPSEPSAITGPVTTASTSSDSVVASADAMPLSDGQSTLLTLAASSSVAGPVSVKAIIDREARPRLAVQSTSIYSTFHMPLLRGYESVADWSHRWSQQIVMVWLLGVALVSLRLVVGTWQIRTLATKAETADAGTQRLADRLGRRLGMSGIPEIVVSDMVDEPMAIQWWRPLVLLPAAWLSQMPPAVLEAVLAHELAHIRRYDLWVNFFQRIVETAWFFHPCVWWVSNQIRMERELCCDVEAVRATGQPLSYAQALEDVARRKWTRRSFPLVANPGLSVGMGGKRMALLHRIKRILGAEPSAADASWWTLGLAGVGISSVCWLGTALWSIPAIGDDAADATVALNQGERQEEREAGRRPRAEGDRERPEGERRERRDEDEGRRREPRDGERRPGGPRDGERPQDHPRDGEGPRRFEGERSDHPHPEAGRRGPGREGPPRHRPPHVIAEELGRLVQESARTGKPVSQEDADRLMEELRHAMPRPGMHAPEGHRPAKVIHREFHRDGDREPGDGPRRPEGDRGAEGERGPEAGERRFDREGPPPRPPHEVAGELRRLMQEAAERGEPAPREQIERLMKELHQHRGPEFRAHVLNVPRGGDMNPEMMQMLRELRGEVQRLRAEVNDLRGEERRESRFESRPQDRPRSEGERREGERREGERPRPERDERE